MTTISSHRIGRQMIRATNYVAANPGTCILPVALAIGPNGSTRYGYAAVHRAIRAGLIRADYAAGRYVLSAS